jgi:TRAP transporter TAXI family solute receptor
MAAACSGSAPGAGKRLSVATGGTGGVFFVYGGGLADQITQHLDGYEATAESTAGSVDNMLLIADEGVDLAFVLADTAADGIEGEGSFEKPVPAQALANLYIDYAQVVTLADSGIESIQDLRGKRVSVGAPNSGTEVLARRLLEAAAIDPDTGIESQQLDFDESVAAMRDGTIDAFFARGGLPVSAITDLATTDGIRLLPTAEYVNELREKYSEVYKEAPIPAGTYEGVDEEVPTVVAPIYLVANKSMDEDLAYRITRLLFERKEALAAVHPEAKNLDLERAQRVAPLQLHPGARHYYREANR